MKSGKQHMNKMRLSTKRNCNKEPNGNSGAEKYNSGFNIYERG